MLSFIVIITVIYVMPFLPSPGLTLYVYHMQILIDSHMLPYYSLLTYTHS